MEKKAQIFVSELTYIGYILKEGKRWLLPAQKQTVLDIPNLQTRRQVREFLGSVRFCLLWIPGFAKLAKPLYEVTRGAEESFLWTDTQEGACRAVKKALLKAPALPLTF